MVERYVVIQDLCLCVYVGVNNHVTYSKMTRECTMVSALIHGQGVFYPCYSCIIQYVDVNFKLL